MKRIRTKYPGVFYREGERIGGSGTERIYYIVFRKDGRLHEEKVGRQYADDMTEAKAARIRAERIEGKRPSRKEIREAEKAKPQPWTIGRLWDEYKRLNPAVKGIAQDENRYRLHVMPLLEKKEPKDLVPLDIDRLRIRLQRQGKEATAKNTLELIRRIVNFGLKKNLCAPPRFKITLPRLNNIKTEFLTPEQIASYLAAADQDPNIHAAAMIRLALFTGLRRGEMFKLRWDDVDFERGFITLRDPKGGVDQKVPLNDAARELLAGHPRIEGSPFVFPGRSGRQRTDIKNAVKRIRDRAGLPDDFRPLHGMRHTFASLLASSGQVDLYKLQRLLTHKSPAMTQRYAHLSDEALKNAANALNPLIAGAVQAAEKKTRSAEMKRIEPEKRTKP